jgi:hypothetical protein
MPLVADAHSKKSQWRTGIPGQFSSCSRRLALALVWIRIRKTRQGCALFDSHHSTSTIARFGSTFLSSGTLVTLDLLLNLATLGSQWFQMQKRFEIHHQPLECSPRVSRSGPQTDLQPVVQSSPDVTFSRPQQNHRNLSRVPTLRLTPSLP